MKTDIVEPGRIKSDYGIKEIVINETEMKERPEVMSWRKQGFYLRIGGVIKIERTKKNETKTDIHTNMDNCF